MTTGDAPEPGCQTSVPWCQASVPGCQLRAVFACLLLSAACLILSLAPLPRSYLYSSVRPAALIPGLYRNAAAPVEHYDDVYFRDLDLRMRRSTTVIYNRVPKCGSSATIAILKDLSRLNNKFHFPRSTIYHTEHMNSNETARLMRRLQYYPRPWLFERHLHFLRTDTYGIGLPLYINFVRKPVDRFISEYYFYRFEHRKPMTEEMRNRTFDQCVLEHFEECSTEKSFVIIPFFCGQETFCLKPSTVALDTAKRNVDKYYGAVGLTEDLIPSYTLLEKTMPHFFSNMSTIAVSRLNSLKSKYKTHKKLMPSKTAVNIMHTRLAMENEFYSYVRHRYIKFLKHYKIQSPLLD